MRASLVKEEKKLIKVDGLRRVSMWIECQDILLQAADIKALSSEKVLVLTVHPIIKVRSSD